VKPLVVEPTDPEDLAPQQPTPSAAAATGTNEKIGIERWESERELVRRNAAAYQKMYQSQYQQRLGPYHSYHPDVDSSTVVTIVVGIVTVATVLRRPFILHGITLMLIGTISERALAWAVYFSHEKETQRCITICAGLLGFWLRQAERAVEGDNVRRYMAGTSMNFWNARGKKITFSVWNAHTRSMKRRNRTEAEGHMTFMEKCYNLFDPTTSNGGGGGARKAKKMWQQFVSNSKKKFA